MKAGGHRRWVGQKESSDVGGKKRRKVLLASCEQDWERPLAKGKRKGVAHLSQHKKREIFSTRRAFPSTYERN